MVPGAARRASCRCRPTAPPAALDAVRAGTTPTTPACRSRTRSRARCCPTLDSLATGSPLQIFAELTLDVAFSIVVRAGDDGRGRAHGRRLSGRRRAGAAVAGRTTARCARWCRPISNAAAAQDVADGRADAGVSTALAAQRYGLAALADGVVDEPNARTRFVLVGPPGPPPARTGADRTSVVLRLGNVPGRARRGADRVRHPRHRPDPHRVPAHQSRVGHLRVLPGLRRPHRRRSRSPRHSKRCTDVVPMCDISVHGPRDRRSARCRRNSTRRLGGWRA